MSIRVIAATVAALGIAGCATTGTDPVVLLKKLDNVDMTRKQLIESGVTPRIVMTFRGNASFFTQTNLSAVKDTERADALKVAAKLREMQRAPGVQGLEQCNLPLADRKLKPADLMQEVKLVPNGWIALGAYQQQGYAYIAP